MSLQIPPQDIRVERMVIASAIATKGALDTCMDVLSEDSFYSSDYKKIFIAMQKMYREDKHIDIMSVHPNVGNLDHFFMELVTESATSTKINEACNILLEKQNLRNIINTSIKATQKAFANEPSGDILAFLENGINEFQEKAINETLHVKDFSEDVAHQIHERMAGRGNTGITTGFDVLDEKMGKYHDGELIIIGARPSMGKTAFMLASAYNGFIKSGKPVLIFSLEMTKVQLFQRLISMVGQVNGRNLRNGTFKNDEYSKVVKSISKIIKNNIFVNDSSNLNIYQIRNICKRMKAKHDIGIVFIDYLQFIPDTGLLGNKVLETGEKATVSKRIAKELNIPVVNLAQLNRGLESRPNKTPILSDLKQSGDIEQDADVVLFIDRPFMHTPKEHDPKETNIIIGKNRSGVTGLAEGIEYVPQFTQFKEIENACYTETQKEAGLF